MRNKRDIRLLDTAVVNVKFPEAEDTSFERYKNSLRHVLEGNFGYHVANTLYFDVHNQLFWVQLKAVVRIPREDQPFPFDDAMVIEVRTNFHIDPHEPLMEQMEALGVAIDEMGKQEAHYAKASRARVDHLVEQLEAAAEFIGERADWDNLPPGMSEDMKGRVVCANAALKPWKPHL